MHTEGRAQGGKEEQKKRAGRSRGPAGVGPPRLRPGVSLWKTARRLSAACGKFLAGKLVNSGERRPRALRGGGVGGEDVSGPAEGGSAADGARGLPSGLGVLGLFSGKGSLFFGGKSTFFPFLSFPRGAMPPKERGRGKLPAPLPRDMILKDTEGKTWRLGSQIGQGGFGLIYLGKTRCI